MDQFNFKIILPGTFLPMSEPYTYHKNSSDNLQTATSHFHQRKATHQIAKINSVVRGFELKNRKNNSNRPFARPTVRPSDRSPDRPFSRPTVRPTVRPSVRPSVCSFIGLSVKIPWIRKWHFPLKIKNYHFRLTITRLCECQRKDGRSQAVRKDFSEKSGNSMYCT